MSTTNQPVVLTVKDGKVYEQAVNDLFTHWVPSTVYVISKAEPRSTWRGPKIPWAMWETIVAFLRWTQKEFKAEAMMMFYFNMKSKEWAVWPFPQQPAGMTIKHLPDHPMYAEDRKRFGSDWVQLGTIHHHCTSGAFQSGTDKDDECNRDGVHITLGKMEDPKLETHTRQVFDGLQTDGHLFNWIQMPPWCETVPKHLKFELFANAIITVPADVAFPEEWKTRVIRFFHQAPGWQPPGSVQAQNLTNRNSPTPDGAGTTRHTLSYTPVGKEWRERTKLRLIELLDQLKMSPMDAWYVMTTERANLTVPQIGQRQEVYAILLRHNLTPMFAEDLIEEMAMEEKIPRT